VKEKEGKSWKEEEREEARKGERKEVGEKADECHVSKVSLGVFSRLNRFSSKEMDNLGLEATRF